MISSAVLMIVTVSVSRTTQRWRSLGADERHRERQIARPVLTDNRHGERAAGVSGRDSQGARGWRVVDGAVGRHIARRVGDGDRLIAARGSGPLPDRGAAGITIDRLGGNREPNQRLVRES